MTVFPPRSRRCSACKGTGLGDSCAPCRGTGQQSGGLDVCTFCGGTGVGSACHECGGPGSFPLPCEDAVVPSEYSEPATIPHPTWLAESVERLHLRQWLGRWALLACTAFAVVLSLHVIAGNMDHSPLATWRRCLLYVVVALLPGLIPDLVRLLERVVIPLWRLLSAMRQLAAGRRIAPLAIRDGDFWAEATDNVNSVISRIHGAEAAHPTLPRLESLLPLLYQSAPYAKLPQGPGF